MTQLNAPLPHVTLVVGGASSGKSAYAEQLACACASARAQESQLIYFATMESAGAEAQERIARHRRLRADKGFETFECPRGLDTAQLPADIGEAVVLLEDIGNLVANELFADYPQPLDADAAYERIMAGLKRVADVCGSLVVVGNEIGSDGEEHTAETAAYVQLVGRVQCAFAQLCDTVIECTAGIPQAVKGTLAQ